MRVSREKVAENRRKILDAAGRLFRERGFEAVTVADVMEGAGLTHGGFYGYFKSKDDLIACALSHALESAPAPGSDWEAYVTSYLSRRHAADRAGGCPTAGLGSEAVRESPQVRAAMTAGLRRQLEQLSQVEPESDPAERRQAAIGTWSAMVGAVILARLSDDPRLSQEILSGTRAWISSRSRNSTR